MIENYMDYSDDACLTRYLKSLLELLCEEASQRGGYLLFIYSLLLGSLLDSLSGWRLSWKDLPGARALSLIKQKGNPTSFPSVDFFLLPHVDTIHIVCNNAFDAFHSLVSPFVQLVGWQQQGFPPNKGLTYSLHSLSSSSSPITHDMLRFFFPFIHKLFMKVTK